MQRAFRSTLRTLGRPAIAAGGLILLAAASLGIWNVQETRFRLDRATIELLEAKISLPEGAYPFDRYVRFYVQIPRQPRYVLGTFVERRFSSTGETPAEQMPSIVFLETTFGVNDLLPRPDLRLV
jgi:hypothetical protein